MMLGVAFSGAGMMSLLPKIGMMAGGMLLQSMSKKDQPTNRLNDLKVSSSAYGRGLPLVYGTMRCTGNMIWATDFEEKRHNTGKKGKEKGDKKGDKGKAKVWYEYFANFAMAMCEGEKSEVIRIWADSNLIYDRYHPDGYTDDDGILHKVKRPGFSQEGQNGGGKGGANKKGDDANSGAWPYRFYGGGEDQMPDAFMQSKSGAQNVPAYRGTCYLMFERFPLTDFGNRIPTITAEIVPKATRKPYMERWTPLSYPDETSIEANNRCDGAWIDPVNDTLWHWQRNNGNLMRKWSVSKQKELDRYYIGGEPLGLDSDGGLCITRSAGYANEFDLVHIGDGSYLTDLTKPGPVTQYQLSVASSGTYWLPVEVIPCFRLKFGTGNTMIRSIFGDVYMESVRHQDRAAPQILRAGIFSKLAAADPSTNYDGMVNPASPYGPNTGSWHVIDGALFELMHDKPGDNSAYYDIPWVQLPFEPNSSIFNGGTVSEPPIWCAGADGFLFINQRPSGVYASVYSKGGEMKWELPLGDMKTSLSRIANGGPVYQPIPGVLSGRWMYIAGQHHEVKVCIIDVQQRAIEFVSMNSYIADTNEDAIATPVGPQYYWENTSAIIYWGRTTVQNQDKFNWWVCYPDKFEQGVTDIKDIILDVCERTGIPRSRVDVSKVKDATITGMMIEQPSSGRSILEQLAQVHFFDVCESDDVLKFVSRGQAPVITMTQDKLASVDPGLSDAEVSEINDWYAETRHQEIDIPRRVHVTYINPSREYQTGTQGYQRPIGGNKVMHSREILDINLPIAMKPAIAIKIAETVCIASWTERISHQLRFGWQFLRYDPTDVMLIHMDNGLTFVDRVVGADVGRDMTVEVHSISQIHPYYEDVAAPEAFHSPYDPKSTPAEMWGVEKLPKTMEPASDPITLDIPYVEDADLSFDGTMPLYWGAAAKNNGLSIASLQAKTANTEYKTVGMNTVDCVWGYALGATPAPVWGPLVTDTQTRIRLKPAYDYVKASKIEWNSVDPNIWPTYNNMVAIGGEIILFRDVEEISDGTVIISHLIRGHRGTENWCNTHVEGEKFVVLTTDGVQVAELENTMLNAEVQVRIGGASIFGALTKQPKFTFHANALRPYAVGDIRRVDDVSYHSTITWQRRTRANGAWKNLVGTVPVNEESLHYRVYIATAAIDVVTFDPGDATSYTRLIETTTETAVYTAAMKALDGVANIQTVWVIIYQLSADVGLGFPAVKKIETDRPAYR